MYSNPNSFSEFDPSDEHTNLLVEYLGDNKRICFFLGAGVSKLAGYPLWGELCQKIIRDLFYKTKDINGGGIDLQEVMGLSSLAIGEPIKVMQRLYDVFEENGRKKLFYNSVRSCMTPNEVKSDIYHELINIIGNLPDNDLSKIFVQTNIDSGLQTACKKEIEDCCVVGLGTINSPLKFINYIHGHFDQEQTWVFTRKQYDEVYLDANSNVRNLLRKIFRDYHVVFIGYSFRDFEVLQSLSELTSRRDKASNEHFYIKDTSFITYPIDWSESQYLKSVYNIHTIFYRIDMDSGYHSLIKFLSKLSEEIVSRGVNEYSLQEGGIHE